MTMCGSMPTAALMTLTMGSLMMCMALSSPTEMLPPTTRKGWRAHISLRVAAPFIEGIANTVSTNNIGLSGAAWNADMMHANAGCSTAD